MHSIIREWTGISCFGTFMLREAHGSIGGTTPVLGCENCNSTQCCAQLGADGDTDSTRLCMPRNSWFCLADNGCKSNCHASIYDYPSVIDRYYYRETDETQAGISQDSQFVFPAGDYSDNDGNPCYGCAEDECCDGSVQCHSIENDKKARCWVHQGCLFNCKDWV